MPSPIEMLVDGGLAYWQFRQVLTIEGLSAGTGTLKSVISPGLGNFFITDTVRVGADDYAANRTVVVDTQDEDDNQFSQIINNALDNLRIFTPTQDRTDINDRLSSEFRHVVVAGDDGLNFNVLSLALNETLTIAIRAFVSSSIPTITNTVTGTDATLATSTTLNKVVV